MSRLRSSGRGLTLIELLVALAIGTLLTLAAVRIYMLARAAYRSAQSIAALEETARFALTALTYDIEHASYWGLTHDSRSIIGRRAQPSSSAIRVDNDCARDWAIDLDAALTATNNRYLWECTPYRDSAMSGADTLTVRHAETRAVASEESGSLYVRTSRFGRGELYTTPGPPPPTAALNTATHALVVRGYYVNRTSSLSTATNAVPSLRAKTLTRSNFGPRIVDEEVCPGVEDLQVELGIDRDADGSPGYGTIDAYVTPESRDLSDGRVLAIRVWLLVRAHDRDAGFTATPPMSYADRSFEARDDGYRRRLVMTTLYARNLALGS